MPEISIVARARLHSGSIVFRTTTTSHTYQDVLDRSALLDHPHIRECVVIGLPGDAWGEAVTAIVVSRNAMGKVTKPAVRALFS